MNAILTTLGLSLLLLFILAFAFNKFVNWRLKRHIQIEENNYLLTLINSGYILGIGICLYQLFSVLLTFNQIIFQTLEGYDLLIEILKYFSICASITLLYLILVYVFSNTLVYLLTKKPTKVVVNTKEYIPIYIAIILLIILSTYSGVTLILEQFIPYPEMPLFR